MRKAGHVVVVFERNSKVGGRVATHRSGGFVWDTGATTIAPRGKRIEGVLLTELDTAGLVKIDKPIYIHDGTRVRPGRSAGAPRYTYVEGNEVFAERLAVGLDVRLGHDVEGIDRTGEQFVIHGEEFDALILTPPVPQTSLILWQLGETRAVGNVHYRPCISVQLGYNNALPPTTYHALLDVEQIHPLTWLSLESVKSPGRAPDGGTAICAQLSAGFSQVHFDQDDNKIIPLVVGFMERTYGSAFDAPSESSVMRWRYSQPDSLATFEHVNRRGARLLVASDGLLGGHVEDAYDIGTRTAELLVEED